jgi:hypothetical protein
METRDRITYLWIGSKVEIDYERRGVFPELRSPNSIYAAAHGARYKVSLDLVKAVAMDALEQKCVKRTRQERGLACSYGTMSKNLVDWKTRSEAIAILQAEQVERDCAPVRTLFCRLGIPFTVDQGE